MTITVRELITNLDLYADDTKVVIKNVDDIEFAIVEFNPEAVNTVTDTVTIIIGESLDEDESDEEEEG